MRQLPGGWRLAVAAVCFGAFMGQLDASIVTLTYRPLHDTFGSSLAAVQWVSLSYLLTLVVLLIPVGRLSDIHGRKLFYLHGFLIFIVGSAACGLAPSLGWLVAFRALQAVGAAMLQANSVALVTTTAPPGHRRSALGGQAAAQALGLALGPTVGGALVDTVGWRWVFGINVPVGIAAVIWGHYLLPRTRQRTAPVSFDHRGMALLATGLTSALLALSAISGLHLPAWCPAVLAAVSVAALFALLGTEQRAKAPLVDLRLLRSAGVGAGLVGALCAYLVLFGPLVLVPVVLTQHGRSNLTAGLVLTALPAGFGAAAAAADKILPRTWGNRVRCTAGASVCTAALAALAVSPTLIALAAGTLAVVGVGLGLYTPANNADIMGRLPTRAAGTGGGLVNMARGWGTALGVALVTFTLNAQGPQLALLSLCGAAVLAGICGLLVPRTHPPSA
ncbi:MFS transporter (plasmid) [Streptomyces sp. CA-142005]|uniref:MFS transporter n=1 Tax=Streptomyces sp. CA-142005 TaxID=3240052 RepID=UPI003D913BB1